MVSAWFPSLRRIVIPTATFAVGAAAKLIPNLSIKAYVVLGALVLVFVGVEEIFTGIRPAARLAAATPAAMDAVSAPIVKLLLDYKDKQNNPISIAGRMCMFRAVRPARLLWSRRYFKVQWALNMKDQPDANISFPVGCGISGQSFGDGSPRLANPAAIAKYALPKRFAKKMAAIKLQAVYCVPVYEPAKGGLQSGKRIGVINLDSSDPKAYDAIQETIGEINAKMAVLADLAARIYQ
jgi:hypothetical protein